MNTKLLLSGSAVIMGSAGILGSFMPHELVTALGLAPIGALPVIVQLLAALLFAFAMVNWTARGSLMGGIYNRPVLLGNLAHFVIGALALTKAVMTGRDALFLWPVAVVYVVFALVFAAVFFRSPVKASLEQ